MTAAIKILVKCRFELTLLILSIGCKTMKPINLMVFTYNKCFSYECGSLTICFCRFFNALISLGTTGNIEAIFYTNPSTQKLFAFIFVIKNRHAEILIQRKCE